MTNNVDWIQKSLQTVYEEGYLNRLVNIYPINENSFRDVSKELIADIKDS